MTPDVSTALKHILYLVFELNANINTLTTIHDVPRLAFFSK